MKDKDQKLIFEAFEGGVRLHKPTGEWERLVDYLIQKGHEENEAKDLANGFLKHRQNVKPEDQVQESKTYEFKVTWRGIRMRAHSRSFDIKSSEEPSKEQLMHFVAKKVKEEWDKHGAVMSDGDKEDIKDPMSYTISRGPVAYGDDEDRGAIGFKRGGTPLHGG